MSAPPLPEIFGNTVLGEDFVEVVSPAGVDWWPQTTGWVLLALVLLALVVSRAYRRLLHWYRNRYRREAAERLQQLAPGSLSGINRLLKLTALAAFPREQVAQLSGEPWVKFLNAQCGEPVFGEALCPLLAQATYTGTTVDEGTHRLLVEASLAWIRLHVNPRDA